MKNASLTDLLTFFLPPLQPPRNCFLKQCSLIKRKDSPSYPQKCFFSPGASRKGQQHTSQDTLGWEERSLFFVNLRPALHLRTGIYQMGWKCQPHLPSPSVSSGAFESFYRPLRWGWRSWEWSGGRMVRVPLMVSTVMYPQCLPSVPLQLSTPQCPPGQEPRAPKALRPSGLSDDKLGDPSGQGSGLNFSANS